MLQEHSPKSNHIERCTYDASRRALNIHFKNGSSETRTGVPPWVWEAMTKAPSAGKYFHNVIKVHYRKRDESDND